MIAATLVAVCWLSSQLQAGLGAMGGNIKGAGTRNVGLDIDPFVIQWPTKKSPERGGDGDATGSGRFGEGVGPGPPASGTW
jgi:hypothetical protein